MAVGGELFDAENAELEDLVHGGYSRRYLSRDCPGMIAWMWLVISTLNLGYLGTGARTTAISVLNLGYPGTLSMNARGEP